MTPLLIRFQCKPFGYLGRGRMTEDLTNLRDGNKRRDRQKQWSALAFARRFAVFQSYHDGSRHHHGEKDLGIHRPTATGAHQHCGDR